MQRHEGSLNCYTGQTQIIAKVVHPTRRGGGRKKNEKRSYKYRNTTLQQIILKDLLFLLY